MSLFSVSHFRFATWQGRLALMWRCKGYSLESTLKILGMGK